MYSIISISKFYQYIDKKALLNLNWEIEKKALLNLNIFFNNTNTKHLLTINKYLLQ